MPSRLEWSVTSEIPVIRPSFTTWTIFEMMPVSPAFFVWYGISVKTSWSVVLPSSMW